MKLLMFFGLVFVFGDKFWLVSYMVYLGGIELMVNVEEDIMVEVFCDLYSYVMFENLLVYWIFMVCFDVKRRVWNGVNGDIICLWIYIL